MQPRNVTASTVPPASTVPFWIVYDGRAPNVATC